MNLPPLWHNINVFSTLRGSGFSDIEGWWKSHILHDLWKRIPSGKRKSIKLVELWERLEGKTIH